jgi:hypothetical protein
VVERDLTVKMADATGEPIRQGRATKIADQEVFHDPEHPSAIELPVSLI